MQTLGRGLRMTLRCAALEVVVRSQKDRLQLLLDGRWQPRLLEFQQAKADAQFPGGVLQCQPLVIQLTKARQQLRGAIDNLGGDLVVMLSRPGQGQSRQAEPATAG